MKTRYERWFDVHSWGGLLLGLLMYVVCFSGTVAVLFDGIQAWELRSHLDVGEVETLELPIDEIFNDFVQRYPEHTKESVFMDLPGEGHPWLGLSTFDAEAEKRVMLNYDPATGEVLGSAFTNAEYLRRLHTDLHLPSPYGRYLVGAFGIVLLILAVGGILIHNKLRKESVSLRTGRSRQLFFTDLHKIIGLWASPFHILIAFTGAMVGLVGILLLVFALVRFDGDQDAAMSELVGAPLEETNQPGELLPLSGFVRNFASQAENVDINFVSVQHREDANSAVRVGGAMPAQLVSDVQHTYVGTTGALYQRQSLREMGAGFAIFGSMTPLHYATFAGFGLKVIYFVLGIMLTSLAASGVVIWAEKRVARKSAYFDYDRWYIGMTIGTCLGMPLATGALLLGAVLAIDATASFFPVLFLSMAIATVGYRRFPATAMLSMASAIVLFLCVAIDVTTRSHLPLTVEVFTINASCLLGAVSLAWFAYVKRQTVATNIDIPDEMDVAGIPAD
ncbi:MAG: PepSY-associated TM helix domain-containing protein [Pseudomonadota bacterium]